MDLIPKHLINGQPGDSVPVDDRGLRYGDGCFETMAVKHGRIPLWERHFRRLSESCKRLKIRLGIEQGDLESELQELIGNVDEAVLRLTVTRGSDQSGYRFDDKLVANRIASLMAPRNYPASYQTVGVAVHLCTTTLSRNPKLAGIKHLNRLDQVLARDEWRDEYVEGLLCDDRGYVVEGTITNLFCVEQDKVITPQLDESGVAGVMRAEVIDRLRRLGVECSEARIDRERLLEADACFLTNALIGVWPVASIDNRTYKGNQLVKKIMESVRELVE